MHHLHLSPLAVTVAAVAEFLLGWLWYGMLFQSAWLRLTGSQKGGDKSGMGKTLGLTFLANWLLAFGLAHAVLWSGAASLGGGVFVGLVCGLLIIAPPLFADDICEKRPLALFAINGGYWLLCSILAGGVVAAFR